MIVYQKPAEHSKSNRKRERVLLFIVTIFLSVLFLKLCFYYNNSFTDVETGYKEGSVINLSKGFDEQGLQNLLRNGGYLQDDRDIDFAAGKLKESIEKRKNGLENLGALNKRAFYVSAAEFKSRGGEYFENRYKASQVLLQYDSSIIEGIYNRTEKPSRTDIGSEGNSILVYVRDSAGKGIQGVLVKLEQHFEQGNQREDTGNAYDTLNFSEGGWRIVSDTLQYAQNRPIEYVRFAFTGEDGKAGFINLDKQGAYSVIPVRNGFEYGIIKGTSKLETDISFAFKQEVHKIRLFDAQTYSQLKDDNVLTVRTPSDFISAFMLWFVALILSFWLVHIYFSYSKRDYDQLVLPLIMMLSGICVLINYAIPDPLTDISYGQKMAAGAIAGVVLLGILSGVNFIKFYNSRWFDFSGFFRRKYYNQPGYLYLALATVFLALLLAFGTGPEGSGVKVNLFFFQPGEVVKYLVIVFFAAYFTRHQDYFMNLPAARQRIKKAIPVITGLLLLMIFYLVLGDMGPALVLCCTYIIFYSVARNDFKELIIGAGTYVLLVVLVSKIPAISRILLMTGATILWFILWMVYSWVKSKTVYPSAIYLVLIIAVFFIGENMPFVGERLAGRNQMFADRWDNQTYGGDQIAHGIWSITTGGFLGQGIGKGNSTVMPANHTDMILASIGEELGFAGLLVIFICMGVLLHRSLMIARKSAHPFSFYLAAGIAAVTAIQFLVIAAGCFGLIPLTGIVVPFLSYGMSGLLINMAAYGIVLSVSKVSGNKVQQAYIQKTYDNTIVWGSLVYSIASIIIIGLLFYYQVLFPGRYIAKPAVVVNKEGERIASINPRIDILLKRLDGGNIYDRNGLLLATGDKADLLSVRDSIIGAGIDPGIFDKQISVKQSRYYPFGSHLFFWTGDYNNRLLWGSNSMGYFAENRHLSLLRGFDSSPEPESLYSGFTSTVYQPDVFLPKRSENFRVSLYDYSGIVALLKAGLNSKKVKEFNDIDKDITLTVDAKLQTRLQNEIGNYLKDEKKNWRTSVVVVDAKTGEVLCSAVSPLPDYTTLKQLKAITSGKEQIRIINRISFDKEKSIFTERDLGLTFPTQPGSTAKIMSGLAALNKLGPSGADTSYYITEAEAIRISGNENEPLNTRVDMKEAIVQSSNVYFIKLINENRLDDYMMDIYFSAGIGIYGKGNYSFDFYNGQDIRKIKMLWLDSVFNHKSRNTYFTLKRTKKTLQQSRFSGLAWGQGEMRATPVAMARVTGAIANKGLMANSKFLKTTSISHTITDTSFTVSDSVNAGLMGSFMYEQAKKRGQDKLVSISAKTGTPERAVPGNAKNNDGWFLFFANSLKTGSPLAVCIRMERAGTSGQAVLLALNKVMPVLIELGYLESNSNNKKK